MTESHFGRPRHKSIIMANLKQYILFRILLSRTLSHIYWFSKGMGNVSMMSEASTGIIPFWSINKYDH